MDQINFVFYSDLTNESKPKVEVKDENMDLTTDSDSGLEHDQSKKLNSHIGEVHERVSEKIQKSKHECEICSKSFGTKQHLSYHVEEVHQKLKPYNCNLCT